MLSVEHEDQGDRDLVHIKGRLGAADGPDAAERLIQILERGSGMLHLEMSGLEWIDSGGLSALVNVLKRARKLEGDVILVNPNDSVRAVLELTRLHEIFEIREEQSLSDLDDRKAVGF